MTKRLETTALDDSNTQPLTLRACPIAAAQSWCIRYKARPLCSGLLTRGDHVLCCAVPVASVVFDSLRPCGLPPTSLLSRDSPGKNTGVGCHTLLQGIFPTQGLNPHLLRLLQGWLILYCWAMGEAHRNHVRNSMIIIIFKPQNLEISSYMAIGDTYRKFYRHGDSRFWNQNLKPARHDSHRSGGMKRKGSVLWTTAPAPSLSTYSLPLNDILQQKFCSSEQLKDCRVYL